MKLPNISIIVCTYNGSKKIDQCVRSLLNQDYPKDRYEIIVVDDGSTDITSLLVSKYPVKLIRHKKNRGLAVVRNSGLKIAKGEIYVCFDDDCIACRDWLKNLIKEYDCQKNPAGIAGVSIHPKQPNIIDLFVNNYYMNPAPLSYGISKNPIIRFFIYLNNMLFPKNHKRSDTYEVYEIYGYSSSFPTKILREVNGWDESLSGTEDVELCQRIHKKFSNKKFYITQNAKLIHDHRLTITSFLKKPYIRGPVVLNYYFKYNKAPPIFPFPVVFIIVTLWLSFYNLTYSLIVLFLLPQLLYIWWLIKFMQSWNYDYLLFPYIQLSYEFMVIVGLIRGFILIFLRKNYAIKV